MYLEIYCLSKRKIMNITNSKSQKIEIDVYDIIKVILAKKAIISLIVFLSAICSLAISYNMTDLYDVNCVLIPADASASTTISDNRSGFAGISLTGDKQNIIAKEIIQIFNSNSFLKTVYEKNQTNKELFGDKLQKIDQSELTPALKEEKKNEVAIDHLRKTVLKISFDSDNETIIINLRLHNKYLAKYILSDILSSLKTYIKNRNISMLEEDIALYKNVIDDNDNSIVKSELLRIITEKINRRYVLSSNIFYILDPPTIPYKKSSPKRVLILFWTSILSTMTCIVIISFSYLLNLKKAAK